MSPASESDILLIGRIREGDSQAWGDLISRFQGRLLSFVESRIRNRDASEDLVQETFLGFLTSLPNYDPDRSLEGYLFCIAAHKLTDYLRREGRRPTLPLVTSGTSGNDWEPMGRCLTASRIVQSQERRDLEEDALVVALQTQIGQWRDRGEWEKMKCAELLFVRGCPNKEVAKLLKMSEQAVANWKYECIAKLRGMIGRQDLCEAVFPELA